MSSNIFEAAASGDLDYLKKNISNLNDKNERGWTALHFSARFGQLEVAQFLKENKVELSEVNSEGKTASELAAMWGNNAVADILKVQATKSSTFTNNHVSIFAGNPLNRFGWKRSDSEFLSKLAKSSKSKYIVLRNQQALYDTDDSLHTLSYSDVSFIVDKVYTENGFNVNNSEIFLVFLGIDERNGKGEDGEAYWALDLSAKGQFSDQLEYIAQDLKSSYTFYPTIPRAFAIDKSKSAIIAQASAMIDWNARNLFCSACGKRTMMTEGGHKRSCGPSETEPKCISHSGVQNFTYPRTDAVVIACIIHPNGDEILLGRQKRWPRNMYSCISGFVEPAESLEEAVRREAYEETGIVVNRVSYHSGQPWPFPNSLMLGFHAEATSTNISFSDDELESACWFSRQQVIDAINGDSKAKFSMAPKGSLAHTLVSAWVDDRKWQNKL